MNRVQELLRTISQSKDSLERLECQYNGVPKGTIYKTSITHHKNKISDTLSKLNLFGESKVIKWTVTFNREAKGIIQKGGIDLYLDQSITEEEIIDRLKLNKLEVTMLERKKEPILLGFPRIKEFSQ